MHSGEVFLLAFATNDRLHHFNLTQSQYPTPCEILRPRFIFLFGVLKGLLNASYYSTSRKWLVGCWNQWIGCLADFMVKENKTMCRLLSRCAQIGKSNRRIRGRRMRASWIKKAIVCQAGCCILGELLCGLLRKKKRSGSPFGSSVEVRKRMLTNYPFWGLWKRSFSLSFDFKFHGSKLKYLVRWISKTPHMKTRRLVFLIGYACPAISHWILTPHPKQSDSKPSHVSSKKMRWQAFGFSSINRVVNFDDRDYLPHGSILLLDAIHWVKWLLLICPF